MCAYNLYGGSIVICLPKSSYDVRTCQLSGADYQTPDAALLLNQNLKSVTQALGADAVIYAYVMTSVKKENGLMMHNGCGPNLEGGLITLCTCKHHMRSAGHWLNDAKKGGNNKWVAGFTNNKAGKNALFYLMKISEAYESHADLWRAFLQLGRQNILDVKSASNNSFGDIYKPKNIRGCTVELRFLQGSYENPIVDHAHDNDWKKDVNYEGYGKHLASLLVGDSTKSFVWTSEMIWSKQSLPRSTKKYLKAEYFITELSNK
jgi:hypothetical protein